MTPEIVSANLTIPTIYLEYNISTSAQQPIVYWLKIYAELIQFLSIRI